MESTITRDGYVFLRTEHSAATPLSIQRTDSDMTNPLAQIEMFGPGEDEFHGGLSFGTINIGSPDKPTEERMRIHTNGNVGIGATKPSEKLEVDGTVKATAFDGDGSKLTGISESKWSDAPGGDIYYGKGNVGIGAADPKAKLDVDGFTRSLGISVNNAANTGVGRGLWLWSPSDSNNVIYNASPTGKSPANKTAAKGYFDAGYRLRLRTATGQGFLFENNKETALADIDSDNGRLWTKGAIYSGNSDLYFTKTDHDHTGIGNTKGYAAIENAKNYDALMILGRSGTAKGRYVRLWDYLQVNGHMDITGNVGIGTSEPKAKLHINGSVRGNLSGALRIDTGNGYVDIGPRNTGWSHFYTDRPSYYFNKEIRVDSGFIGSYNEDLQLRTQGTTRITIRKANGNVGIGTTKPVGRLDVVSPWGDWIFLRQSRRTGGGGGFHIHNPWKDTDTADRNRLEIGYRTSKGEDKWGQFVIHGPTGNVGIGTVNPGNDKLDVRGRCYSSGGWRTTNRDYAEYFESDNGFDIPVGTSVSLTKDGKIKPSKKNQIPIGIISTNSAIVGNSYKEWPKKYLRDEFDNLIMEEYEEELMVPKKEKVTRERQKLEKKTIKEEVTRTEIAFEDGKYIQKEISETVTREVEEPPFEEVDLYDTSGKNVIGKHQIPIMETYEEEIEVLDENDQPVLVGTGEFVTKQRPKLNPEYDESHEYVSREERPEWNCVGLLGQLPLSRGQPVAPTWIKIKDISKEVELWLVK